MTAIRFVVSVPHTFTKVRLETREQVHAQVLTLPHTCMHTRVCPHVCTYVYTSAFTHTPMYTRAPMHAHAYKETHIHKHILAPACTRRCYRHLSTAITETQDSMKGELSIKREKKKLEHKNNPILPIADRLWRQTCSTQGNSVDA